MNIIFKIDGGLGKSVMGTAICEVIKKQYPKSNLIVITSYPEVFLCNPFVDKTYHHDNMTYFYKDVIDNKQIKAFLHNPYFETSFITREKHLLETWCEMFELKYTGEKPQIFLSQREELFYVNQSQFQKPLFVLQTNGGADNQGHQYSWARDIPINVAQEIVNEFSKDYDIFHIRKPNQIQLQNTISFETNFRHLCVLIKYSTKRLLIDSFAQHVAASFNLSSIVCWIANDYKQFGYETNVNIQSNQETLQPELKFSQFSKYNIAGEFVEFPYKNEMEIFDTQKIIEELKKV
jgi:hypothetical protein